jgi:hypothetical protein
MQSETYDQYWATLDPLQLVGCLQDKVDDFDRYVDMSGRWINWRDLYYNYFLVNEQNYSFPTYGADGFKRLNVNHFRADLRHLLSLITAQRVAPIPVATNSDYKSQAQVDFSKNILNYVEKEKRLDDHFERATEMALLLGCAYVSREWDATLGDAYAPDPATGAEQRKGDFVIDVHGPLDVIFDYSSDSWENCNWYIIRRYFNRWDLVNKFPAYAEQIKGASAPVTVKRHRLGHLVNEFNEDIIPLYTFYHKRTSSVPNGRASIFIDGNVCLFDGDLPYKRIPLSRIATNTQLFTPFPYTVAMDLLPIQKVYNALCSTITTNQAAFGVQNILIPREASVALTQLTEGLNAIYYDPSLTQGAKPEALNLLATAGEIFKWVEYLEQKMHQLSGVNDTIRGNPEANLKSGTALAFVASQALTFISPLSRSYNSMMEETWTGIIDILKEFATTPRLVLISGVNNRSLAKQFTGDDISGIDRVLVEAGNPLMNTLAGRVQIAQELMNAGVMTKEEYFTVLRTGQIEPLYAYERAELMSIKAGLEDLQNGKEVIALITDNHPLWMREIMTLLSDPEVRRQGNSPVIQNATKLYQEHDSMWGDLTQKNPAILAVQNIPPRPSPQGPPPPGAGDKISISIDYKDLPPQAQAELAAKVGIPLTPQAPQGQPTPPQGPAGAPHPGPAGLPGHPGQTTNPNGSKVPGAPNLPNVPQNTPSAPTPGVPGMPVLPKGSPAINQEAYSKIQGMTPPPQMPH